MRLLILSQVYWPDTASTAQHLADLAAALSKRGHNVRVLASQCAYENPSILFPKAQNHEGVRIERLPQTRFGKASLPGRMVNFASFNLCLFWRLIWLKRDANDFVLGLTSPPLVSFFGALVARWKGWSFCYWAMDLQPELAIEAGLIRRGSVPARLLDVMGRAVFHRADRIVAMDRFMAAYIMDRGVKAEKVCVRRLWPVTEARYDGPRMENPFRRTHGFGDRMVVMYSGNHAVVHPLATLLDAILQLRDDRRFLFVFIGGGARVADVTLWRESHALDNILQIPYQPRSDIHLSLSSADLHAVVMGDGQVGYTHPNKVYGAMALGRPFVYVGPSPSHITDLIDDCPGNLSVRHGEGDRLAVELRHFVDAGQEHRDAVGAANARWAESNLSPSKLISLMGDDVEAAAAQRGGMTKSE